MKRNFFHKAAATVTAAAMVLTPIAANLSVHAAALTSEKDVLTRLQMSTAADHTITFTTPTGVTLGQTMTFTFAADFNLTSIVEDDVDVKDDAVELTTAADCTGSEMAGVSVTGQILTVEICAGDGGAIGAASVVEVQIGTNATASGTGANQIVNPGSAASYEVQIGGTQADSGAFEVPILDDDTVDITGYIDESITFDIDTDETTGTDCAAAACTKYASGSAPGGYTVDLGLMTTSTINSSSDSVLHEDGGTGAINYIMFDLSTNATGGAAVTVASLYDQLDGPGSDAIPSVSDLTLAAGDGNYGINEVTNSATNGAFTVVSAYDGTVGSSVGTVADAGTPIEIFNTGGAALNVGRIEFEVSATPDSLDGAGTYNDALTFVATGTF